MNRTTPWSEGGIESGGLRARTEQYAYLMAPLPLVLARRHLPADYLAPLLWSSGRGICALMAAQFDDALMGRFRVAAIGFFATPRPAIVVPYVPLLLRRFLPGPGVFLSHLAVDRPEAARAIEAGWGMPCATLTVELRHEGERCTVALGRDQRLDVAFRVETGGSFRRYRSRLALYATRNGSVPLRHTLTLRGVGVRHRGHRAGHVAAYQHYGSSFAACLTDISRTVGPTLASGYATGVLVALGAGRPLVAEPSEDTGPALALQRCSTLQPPHST